MEERERCYFFYSVPETTRLHKVFYTRTDLLECAIAAEPESDFRGFEYPAPAQPSQVSLFYNIHIEYMSKLYVMPVKEMSKNRIK
jgi:hypothetical protein